MSIPFGGGGSSGNQIRYAVVLDDTQFTTRVGQVKNTLTQLGTATTTAGRNVATMNQAFSAGVTQINAQGNALANNKRNLDALNTSTKTIGTQVRDLGSRFGTLAVGLGSTASQVAGLGRNYRDLNDLQIMVDRTARRVSVAQEQVDKTTRKVNQLRAEGKTNTKEFADAQRDLQQAQQNLSVNTRLLGERQEDLADFQTDFAINVIPTMITAVGTLGVAFKDLGLNGGKLKGVFTILGTALTGLISNFTGVAKNAPTAAAGITALGGASTTATGAVGGLKAALVGIAGPLAALAAGAVIGNQLGASNPEIVKFRDSVDSSAKSAADALGPFTDLFNKYREFIIKTFPQFASEAEKASVGLGTVTKEADKGIKFITANSTEMEDLGKVYTEVDRIMGPMSQTFDKTGKAVGTMSGVIAETSSHIDPIIKQLNDAKFALNFFNTTAFETSKPLTDIEKGFQQGSIAFSDFRAETTVNIAKAKQYRQELIDWATQEAHLANATSLSTKELELHFKATQGDTEAAKELFNIMNPGIAKFNEFTDALTKNVIAEEVYRNALLGAVSAQMKLPEGIDLTTNELEQMRTSLEKARLGLEGGADAAKILADAFNRELAPSMQTFNSAITADKWKDFKKAFKDIPGIGDFSSKARNDLRDLIGDFRKVGKAAQEVGTDISAAILGAFEGIDSKSLKSFTTNLRKDINEIAKIDIDATKFKPITDFLDSLTAENRASGIIKIKDSLALMQDAMADGNVTAEEAAAVIAKFNEETGKTPGPLNNSSAAVQAFGKTSAGARAEIDAVTGAIDVLNAQAKSIKPVIEVDNKSALKAIDVIAKRIDSLEKLKPQISLQNSKAIKAVDVVAKRIDSLEKIKPQISLDNKKAIKAVDVVAKRINSLSSLHPTINATVKVGITGPGAKFAQHGMHETLAQDTLIMAHKGERVDIGGGPRDTALGHSSGGSGGGGGFSGNIIVEAHIMNETIVRKTKAEMGRSRFIFG